MSVRLSSRIITNLMESGLGLPRGGLGLPLLIKHAGSDLDRLFAFYLAFRQHTRRYCGLRGSDNHAARFILALFVHGRSGRPNIVRTRCILSPLLCLIPLYPTMDL